jgi:hypothetical protein
MTDELPSPAEQPEPDPRARFRHLPPRITPDEMVTVHPVVHAVPDDAKWTADEREIIAGRLG